MEVRQIAFKHLHAFRAIQTYLYDSICAWHDSIRTNNHGLKPVAIDLPPQGNYLLNEVYVVERIYLLLYKIDFVNLTSSNNPANTQHVRNKIYPSPTHGKHGELKNSVKSPVLFPVAYER